MKKFFSIAALALAMSTGVQAQTDVVPNRMIINSSVASKAYAVDHVDSISFARKDGEVKANVVGDSTAKVVNSEQIPPIHSCRYKKLSA